MPTVQPHSPEDRTSCTIHRYDDGQAGQVKRTDCPATLSRGTDSTVHRYDEGLVEQVKPTDWTTFQRTGNTVHRYDDGRVGQVKRTDCPATKPREQNR